MEDVKATATNAKAITAGARDLIAGNRGKFDNDHRRAKSSPATT